jgi:hypothetical protein
MPAESGALFVLAHALALFVSAFALFWVQPLFARMVMPSLGGSPAVWNTCVAFFQTALLAGYAYAHTLIRWPSPSKQLVVHMGILILGGAFLPVSVQALDGLGAAASPIGSLLTCLTVSIAVPFVAISATTPLLQGFFARSRHAHAGDPYFLFGASNLGSIGALVAFPFLIEGHLTIAQQTWTWLLAYLAVVLLVAVCGISATRHAIGSSPVPSHQLFPRLNWHRRLAWLAFSAVPSSLLIGVTTHITTDIAAAPLFWVVPLTLYLLSFVVAFARRRIIGFPFLVRAVPLSILIVGIVMLVEARLGLSLPVAANLTLHLTAFFLICLLNHTQLHRHRPPSHQLGQFYLTIALGGMLGGTGTALLAPAVFNGVYEYPVALVAAALLVPVAERAMRPWDLAGAAVVLGIAIGFDRLVPGPPELATGKLVALAALTPLVVIALATRRRPIGFALCVAAALAGAFFATRQADILWRGRSFFGAYRIEDTRDGFRLLYHGTTIHGAEWIDASKRRVPATYYAPDSPASEIIERYRDAYGLKKVGIVGLGVGSLACYRAPGEHWRFYEIDPLMVWIATASGYFHFLSDCAEKQAVIVADGRLGLRNSADSFELLIIDAFTSDAIPIHLLTAEAVQVYLDRLAPQGVLVLHVSNRHVDLAPLIARHVAERGLSARIAYKTSTAKHYASLASSWIALARHAETFDALHLSASWSPLPPLRDKPAWTDNASNIVQVIKEW